MHRELRLRMAGLVLSVAGTALPSFGQLTPGEPGKQEIVSAYRSRHGEVGAPIPGLRHESWGIKEIRGWSLKFKRLHEDHALS